MTIAQDPTFKYDELGFNNRLQATDSLAAKNEAFINAYEFDTNTDRNAVANYNIKTITADKISAGTISSEVIYSGSVETSQIKAGTLSTDVAYGGTLNFNQIYGGTASLGGTLNGNGVLTAYNNSGVESVLIYNGGMMFNPTTGVKFLRGTTTIGTADIDGGDIGMSGGTSLLIANIGSGYEIQLEADEGNIQLYCDSNGYIKMSYGSSGVKFYSNGIQTGLLTKEGNLNIKGTIAQNVSF